jgi:hypothetical protein
VLREAAMKRHDLRAGTIWEGDWTAAPLEPGYTLAILDGPYGIGKAAWDRMGVEGLAEWYRPHLERVGALLAASASMYVWNTAPGLKRLDPVIRDLGWTWRADVVWDKGGTPAVLASPAWPMIYEVAGCYTRGAPPDPTLPGLTAVWRMSHTEYASERLRGDGVLTSVKDGYQWAEPLHPCQKPLLFAERMIRASSRPGERVLIPFGGTLREAVVCEWLARSEPAEARRYDVCELNQDGPDYIGAALAQIRGEDTRRKAAGQIGLFRASA